MSQSAPFSLLVGYKCDKEGARMWAALKFDNRSGAIFALLVSANLKCVCYVGLKLVWRFHSIISTLWRGFVLSGRFEQFPTLQTLALLQR